MGGFWYCLKSNLTPHGSNLSAVSSGISLAFLAIFSLVRYYGSRLQPKLPLHSALSGVHVRWPVSDQISILFWELSSLVAHMHRNVGYATRLRRTTLCFAPVLGISNLAHFWNYLWKLTNKLKNITERILVEQRIQGNECNRAISGNLHLGQGDSARRCQDRASGPGTEEATMLRTLWKCHTGEKNILTYVNMLAESR